MLKALPLLGLLAVLAGAAVADASPGGLDSNGGHTCRTNCAQYGLATGQYHCHRSPCGTYQPPPSTTSPSSTSTAPREEPLQQTSTSTAPQPDYRSQLEALIRQNEALTVQLNAVLAQNADLSTRLAGLTRDLAAGTDVVANATATLDAVQAENTRLKAATSSSRDAPGSSALVVIVGLAAAGLLLRRHG